MTDFSYIHNRYTLHDFDFAGKTVCIRVDFNVPVSSNGEVLDDIRIRESLPTIQYVIANGGKVVLLSHFKRPKGWEEDKSLKPVAQKLGEILAQPILFLEDKVGSEELKRKIQSLALGHIALLENIRFYPEETQNDNNFSRALASLCDIYLNDAFGTMHRAHSSTAGIAQFVPSGLGLLPLKELEYVDKLVHKAQKPLTVILAGGKTSTKINLLKGLMEYTDHILIGGGMVFTFLKAMGYKIGKSLYEEDTLSIAQDILELSKTKKSQLHFPLDIVCAREIKPHTVTQTVSITEGIPDDMMGLDIGKQTQVLFADIIEQSNTIFWNGPVGVFEVPPFDAGTKAIAHSIGKVAHKEGVMTLIGGGESAMAAQEYGIANVVSHMSTGGGALLELLEGIQLPGILAIPIKKNN